MDPTINIIINIGTDGGVDVDTETEPDEDETKQLNGGCGFFAPPAEECDR